MNITDGPVRGRIYRATYVYTYVRMYVRMYVRVSKVLHRVAPKIATVDRAVRPEAVLNIDQLTDRPSDEMVWIRAESCNVDSWGNTVTISSGNR